MKGVGVAGWFPFCSLAMGFSGSFCEWETMCSYMGELESYGDVISHSYMCNVTTSLAVKTL